LVEVGSGSGGGDPQWEERWAPLPNQYRTPELTIYPTVDIDTDSNNSGMIERSVEEELMETQYPGKRLFINHNDTNRNGIPDKDEMQANGWPAVYDEPDKDLVEAILDFGLSTYEGLEGFKLVLFFPEHTDVWSTPTRVPFTEYGAEHSRDHRVVSWTIDESWIDDDPFPLTVYVEGTALWEGSPATGVVGWATLPPPGSGIPLFADHARFTVEPIVWPSNESGTEWKTKPTTQWNGFTLPAGWYIDKTLEQLIQPGAEIGNIRTMYPDTPGIPPVDPTDPDDKGQPPFASFEEGDDSYSTNTYPGGFTLYATFRFDRSVGWDGYVQGDTNRNGVRDIPDERPDHDRPMLSFFANSGIKIWQWFEIQIFDTNQLLGLEGFNVDAAGIVRADGYWPDEGVNLLMTGIAYGSAYPNVPAPNDIFMLDFHAPNPQTPDYHQTLVNNAGRFSDDEHTLKVIFQPVGAGTYDVKTYLVSNGTADLLYHNPQVTHGTGTTGQQYALADVPANQRTVRLQSHWDSGVIFTAVTITDPPE